MRSEGWAWAAGAVEEGPEPGVTAGAGAAGGGVAGVGVARAGVTAGTIGLAAVGAGVGD